ncbi:MAG: Slp family lipoprotein [bacterium]
MKSALAQFLIVLIPVMLAGGCASTIPEEIKRAPSGDMNVAEVLPDPDRFNGTEVRWGGEIASVQNFKSHTQIEIVARELYSSGRPLGSAHSAGRFLANIQGFLDPAVYSDEREITVFGIVTGSSTRPIGEYRYSYPIIDVSQYVLWQPLPRRDPYYHYPYWHDPWYDPWYRHRRWRYPYRYR